MGEHSERVSWVEAGGVREAGRQAVVEMVGFDKGSPGVRCLSRLSAGDVLSLNDAAAGATSVTWSEEPAASG